MMIGVITVARTYDLKWALNTLWKTLPANRGPGGIRERCEDFERVNDSTEACSVIGHPYGFAKPYRVPAEAISIVEDFIEQVPPVDHLALRRQLFVLYLEDDKHDQAHQQVQHFDQPSDRIKLLKRLLSYTGK